MWPHQPISTFLFIASLDAFNEPPNGSSLKGSKSAPRFSSQDSLAFCPFCSPQSQTQGASFCSFASWPRNPLGGPDHTPKPSKPWEVLIRLVLIVLCFETRYRCFMSLFLIFQTTHRFKFIPILKNLKSA